MFLFENRLAYLNNRRSDLTNSVVYSQGRLTTDALSWSENDQQYRLPLSDVVGVSLGKAGTENDLFCLVVHSYLLTRIKKWFGTVTKRRRVLQTHKFACPDAEVRSRWLLALQSALHEVSIESTLHLPPRRLHIILNPVSGDKQARQVYPLIKPVFEHSNIQLTVTETTGIGHGYELTKAIDLAEIEGLVIMGGDGTVHEVINGLMDRADWKTAIQTPIGVIPAGTGNGLCKTLLDKAGEPYDPMSAAFLVAKGKCQSFDLIEIEQAGNRQYSFLSVEWAIASDVDLGSECLRWLGSFRHVLYALICILRLRAYKGRFAFLPASSSHPHSPFVQNNHWQVIEDEFVLFWAMNTKWATHDMKMAPRARLCDGFIDVIIIRKGVSRLQLLMAFLKTATGEYVNMQHVEYYKVRQFSIEPLTQKGILAVDGEQAPYSLLKATVQQSLACIMG